MASLGPISDPSPPARMSYSQSVKSSQLDSRQSDNNRNKTDWRGGTGPRSVFFSLDESIVPSSVFYKETRKALPIGIGLAMKTHKENGSVVAKVFLNWRSSVLVPAPKVFALASILFSLPSLSHHFPPSAPTSPCL